jgi:hypothetical protein
MAMGEDLARAYEAYLARFQDELGDSDFGAFVKHNGRLIQKLRFEQFTPVYDEYCEMLDRYRECVERGDTINDIIVRLVRDRASHLVLPSPF